MLGEIKKFLRDDGIIKISRNIKELGFRIKELNKIYLAKTGEKISISLLSQKLELPKETIYMALEANKRVESIYSKIDDEGSELLEIINSDEDEQVKIVNKITVDSLIKKLSKREKIIINLRYYGNKTQSQVAKILGISQVHVSRIEKKILSELKNEMLA